MFYNDICSFYTFGNRSLTPETTAQQPATGASNSEIDAFDDNAQTDFMVSPTMLLKSILKTRTQRNLTRFLSL